MKTTRLVSLDAFRGITIAGMILVNKPGSWDHVYPPLLHASWNGWTPTDLIFPFFLFIVGVAMTFSFARRLAEADRRAVYLQVIRRSLIIFAIGLFLNAFPTFHLSELRVAGVLQRIAIVYFFSSIIVLNTGIRGQIAWFSGILLAYWGLLTLVPVPGHGAGVLTPEGNLAAFVDSYLLPGRMWQGSWDPEGILSTLPALATTLSGYLTGLLLRSNRSRPEITAWMFVAGWGSVLAGIFWDIWFPINKNLWTSSYVLFTTGAALQLLGVCYWLIDVVEFRRWAFPAVVYGLNAITVYVLSGMVTDLLHAIDAPGGNGSLWNWIYDYAFASWASPVNASLAFALCYVLFWFLMMYLFFRRRIFIKI